MPISRRALLAGALPQAVAGARAWGQEGALPLGALYPFSGMLALLGDESFRGLELAADERNAAGGLLGRQVRLVKGDAVDPGAAVSEVKRLLGPEKASAVFGTMASPLVFAASQVTELAGIPYFELGSVADAVTDRGFRLLFRSCPNASQLAELAVGVVTDVLAPLWGVAVGELKTGILHEDGLYGSSVGGAELALCKRHGLPVTDKIAYSASTTDLGSAVQRLRGAGVSVVLHAGYGNDTVLFFRQMKQVGWLPRMVVGAGGGYALSDTASAIGSEFDGTLLADFPPYGGEVSGQREVEAAYERKYGAKPRSGHSLANYVGARIFLDAVARAGSLDKDRVREAVMATDLQPGAAANGWGARFDDKGQNTRAAPVVAQWQGGVLRTVLPAGSGAVLQPRMGG